MRVLGGAADPPSPGLCRAALHLRRSRPARRIGQRTRVSISYLGLTREARAAGEAGVGLAKLVSLLPLGGSPRPAPPALVAERSCRGCGLGGSGATTRAARRERQRRIAITFGQRWPRLERGAGPAALRAAVGGGAGAGSRPQVRRPRRPARPMTPRPPPHPRHRHRPAARQDQIPPGGVRTDAAALHPAAIAADRRGAGRPPAAQAEFPPADRAAGPGGGNRRR